MEGIFSTLKCAKNLTFFIFTLFFQYLYIFCINMKNGKMFSLRKRSGKTPISFLSSIARSVIVGTLACVFPICQNILLYKSPIKIYQFSVFFLFCRKESLSQIDFNLTSTTLQIQLQHIWQEEVVFSFYFSYIFDIVSEPFCLLYPSLQAFHLYSLSRTPALERVGLGLQFLILKNSFCENFTFMG